MKSLCAAAVSALIGLATAAPWAAEPLPDWLVSPGFSAEESRALSEKLVLLGEAGLLGAPLEKKIREGVAKGVPPSVIAKVASQLADNMAAAARRYPGEAEPAVKTPAVEAAARAMFSGVKAEAMDALFDALPSSKLERPEWHRPFTSLGALILAGAGERESMGVLCAALEAGATPAEISNIPARFRGLLSSGLTHREAADAMIKNQGKEKPDRPDGVQGKSARDVTKETGGWEGEGGDNPATLRGSGKGKFKEKPGKKK